MASIPLQRSKALLESDGWHVDKCEYWNQWSGQRRDLFHLADLVAVRRGQNGTTYVQCCGEDIQGHIRKILEGYAVASGKHKGDVIPPNPHTMDILLSGNRIVIHGWRMRKHSGTRDTWQLREVELLLENGEIVPHENAVKED